MGTTNFGNQTLTFKYKETARSSSFNRLNYKLFPTGIYEGGNLSYIDSSTVRVSPVSLFLNDSINKLGLRLSTTLDVDLAVLVSTPYIVIRFEWIDAENNYADFLAVATPQTDDIVIGRCSYNTSNVLQTTFDLNPRTESPLAKLGTTVDNLKVTAEEPVSNTVYVNAGTLLLDELIIDFTAQSSPTISATTLGRIDLVHINSSGTLLILEGVDSGSPVQPAYPTSSVVLATINRGAGETVIRGDHISNIDVDRGASVSLQVAFDYTDTHENRTDNPHAVTKAQVGLTDTPDWAGDTDIALTADSDTRIVSQKAVKSYIDSSAPKITGTTGESVTAGDAVYFATDGLLYIADNRDFIKSIAAGIALTTQAISESVDIRKTYEIDLYTGLTIGTDYYLGNTGNLILKGAIGYDENTVFIGRAISTTAIDANLKGPEAQRGQDDSTPISALVKFPVYKDRTSKGYIAYTHNSVSQGTYAALFAEIGHVYNNMHVDAGGADLSASGAYFYPTPIPGYYEKGGTEDTSIMNATTDVDDVTELITLSTEDYNALHMTRGVLGTGADGVPVAVKLLTGVLPIGLTEDTVYFIRFKTTPTIELYSDEASAIDIAGTTNRVGLTDAVGTFRLTQEGIILDDVMQRITGTTGAVRNSSPALASGAFTVNTNEVIIAGAGGSFFGMDFDSGDSPDARASNETRPKTNFSFGYIKAEHITTSGEPVSALRKVIDWSLCTNWTSGSSIIINHGLNTSFDDLIGQIFIRDPAVPGKIYNVTNLEMYPSSSANRAGQRLNGIDGDLNNCYLQIMLGGGGIYISDTVGNVTVPTSWEYEVILIKPNLINTFFDPSDYAMVPVGGVISWPTATAPVGFLSVDGSEISRDTYSDLFDVIGETYGVGNGSTTFTLPKVSYETGWISIVDVTNVSKTVTHNMKVELPDLDYSFYISPTGADSDSFLIYQNSPNTAAATSYGLTTYNKGVNSFDIKIGLSGLLSISEATGYAIGVSPSFYYKVVVQRRDFPKNSIIRARNVSVEVEKLTSASIADLTVTNNTVTQGTIDALKGITVPILHVQDQKTSGTNGGTFDSGAWRTRVLNTELTNTITGASLASDQITLPPGTYKINASAPAYDITYHQAILYDTTGLVDLIGGTSEYARADAGGENQTRSFVNGIFILSIESVLELRHRSNASSGSGFGLGTIFTTDHETFTDVFIEKIG